MGYFLISIILVVLVAVQIVMTLTTAKELDALRKSIKTVKLSLDNVKTTVGSLAKDKTAHHKRSSQTVSPKKDLSGELDLYHQGQVATVKAVFRPGGR
jgi:hypothetical protein